MIDRCHGCGVDYLTLAIGEPCPCTVAPPPLPRIHVAKKRKIGRKRGPKKGSLSPGKRYPRL